MRPLGDRAVDFAGSVDGVCGSAFDPTTMDMTSAIVASFMQFCNETT